MTYSREAAMQSAKGFVRDYWADKSHRSDLAGMYTMSILRSPEGWQAGFKFYEERRWRRSKARYATEHEGKVYACFAAIVHAYKHTGYSLDEIVCRAFLGGGS